MPWLLAWFSMFFFLMIRRPPRSTLDRSSAASDVYKRQHQGHPHGQVGEQLEQVAHRVVDEHVRERVHRAARAVVGEAEEAVSYTHLRAHETVLDLVCRLLLENKKYQMFNEVYRTSNDMINNI